MLELLSRNSLSKRRWLRLYAPISAVILWGCLWFNLNTGFWFITTPHSASDLLNLIRYVLPFVVIPVAGLILLQQRKLHLPKKTPTRLLIVYGSFATLASVFSPAPWVALYWSTGFLATILAAWTFIEKRDSLESARQLLQITWLATFIVAAFVGYQARNSVFGDALASHGVLTDLNGLSRSSGVARWAAVPGLVCLIRAYYTRRRALMAFYLSTAAVSFFIVYRMQSRGAIFGSVAAMLFALLVSSRMRRYALPFAAVAIVLILILESPETVSTRVAQYVERGQNREQFLSMTGRTRAYRLGFAAFLDAPFLGRGQWADRIIIHEHSHNSFLQALLNGGLFGGIPYFLSWGVGWILFYRLQKKSARLSPEDRQCLLEAGAVMMFFTVRAIPETTTASFSVDLMVMVAVYVYIESLTYQVRATKFQQATRPIYVVPSRMNRSGIQTGVVAGRRI